MEPTRSVYDRILAAGTANVVARLYGNISEENGCWVRPGFDRRGYTVIGFGKHHQVLAHRASWALANGRDPGAMLVCHTCDNRRCVNPSHLFLGTQKDNHDDMVAKGRMNDRSGPRNRKRGLAVTAEIAEQIKHEIGTNAEIAVRYGVSTHVVYSIRTGRTWNEASRAARRAARARQSQPRAAVVASPFHARSNAL